MLQFVKVNENEVAITEKGDCKIITRKEKMSLKIIFRKKEEIIKSDKPFGEIQETKIKADIA